MSCLEATFTLTPQSPSYVDSSLNNYAYLYCYGADFWPWSPWDLSSLYASNRFFFDANYAAADPNLNYAQWANLKKVRYLNSYISLQSYAAAHKQLALIFGFDVLSSTLNGRVLVYSNAGLLQDQTLVYGDNQFLLEIESLDQPLFLYFIHAGGHWFFTGLSGYVV
jgi:hypothetical protein